MMAHGLSDDKNLFLYNVCWSLPLSRAKVMQALLIDIAKAVEDAGGCLPPDEAERWRRRYRGLLKKPDTECPPPDENLRKGKRGRLKRSKARNLLERLRDFEQDVLRFMEVEVIPFTNNQGENDVSAAGQGHLF